jgi:hypothetical protein
MRQGEIMDKDLQRATHLIGPNGTLLLRDIERHTILAVSGRMWITQHGDSRDVFLEPGQQLSVERHGDTVVQALGSSAAIVLVEPPAAGGEDGKSSLAAAIDAQAARLVRQRGTGERTARTSLELVEHEARCLRSAAIRHLVGQALAAFERGWARLRAGLRSPRAAECAR